MQNKKFLMNDSKTMFNKTKARINGQIGQLGAVVCLMGALFGASAVNPACAATPLDVEITAGDFNPNPLPAGEEDAVSLDADLSDAPPAFEENQVDGLAWAWTIESVEYHTPTETEFAPATAYYDLAIEDADSTDAAADLVGTFFRKGSWKITLKVEVNFTDPSTDPDEDYHGSATHEIYVDSYLNATLQVRRQGSGNSFSSSAIVAAGAKSAVEHNADVEVLLKDSDGNPVSGVLVDGLKITGTEGAGIVTSADFPYTDTTTGTDGKVTATYRSSDIIKVVHLELDQGTTLVTATINQKWNDMPGETDWQFDPFMLFDTNNQLTFTPRFDDNGTMVPTTSHTMTFSTTDINVFEWDDEFGYLEISYTTDAAKQDLTADPPVIFVSNLDDYATYNPTPAGDSGNGTYITQLFVPWDDYNVVSKIYFDVEDDHTYDPSALTNP